METVKKVTLHNLHFPQYTSIFFNPNNNELLNYAESADFGIIPLMGDSLNTKLSALNKVSEYLMAGLPILCSDYTNLQKIIYSNPVGKVGETFNIDSTDSISKAINSILKNKQYKKLKPNALKLAHEFFNWEKEEEKLINIYATINTTT